MTITVCIDRHVQLRPGVHVNANHSHQARALRSFAHLRSPGTGSMITIWWPSRMSGAIRDRAG